MTPCWKTLYHFPPGLTGGHRKLSPAYVKGKKGSCVHFASCVVLGIILLQGLTQGPDFVFNGESSYYNELFILYTPSPAHLVSAFGEKELGLQCILYTSLCSLPCF